MPCITSVALAIETDEEMPLTQLRAAIQKAIGEIPMARLAILEININMRWKSVDEKK